MLRIIIINTEVHVNVTSLLFSSSEVKLQTYPKELQTYPKEISHVDTRHAEALRVARPVHPSRPRSRAVGSWIYIMDLYHGSIHVSVGPPVLSDGRTCTGRLCYRSVTIRSHCVILLRLRKGY